MQHGTPLVSLVKAKGGQYGVQLNVLVHCARSRGEGKYYVYKWRFSRYVCSESDALYNAVNKSLQSFDLVFSLGYVVFDRDRFRQGRESC